MNQDTVIIAGKKETTYRWDARSPMNCISDLVTFCMNLQDVLGTHYNQAVPLLVGQLYKIFDLEKAVNHLCDFSVEGDKLVISQDDRINWEMEGMDEFAAFYKVVCNIHHIRKTADQNHSLLLLPYHSNAVFKKFKDTLEKIIWLNLGNCTNSFFVDNRGEYVDLFNECSLVSRTTVKQASLDQWYDLEFSSGISYEGQS